LMGALIFGRIGCFLNGCCYGKPAELPWAVRFPYGSFAYRSQVHPDPDRHRAEPHLELPDDYFGYRNEQGTYVGDLKPAEQLSPEQKVQVTTGPYRCLAVHPTQLYTSGTAALFCLVLYGFWRRSQKAEESGRYRFLTKPGSTFSLMFVLYGLLRFFIEFLRDSFWASDFLFSSRLHRPKDGPLPGNRVAAPRQPSPSASLRPSPPDCP